MSRAGEDRAVQIVAKATELFSRDGFQKVTTRQLAEACGITEAALYRYYRSKDEIYVAVLDTVEARLADQVVLDDLREVDDVEDLLTQMANRILSCYRKNTDLCRLLLFASLEGHDRARRVFDVMRGKYIKFLIRSLDRLHSAGNVVEKNNEITARCFVGMVFDCAMGFSIWRGMQGRIHDPGKVIANNVPIYVYGLKKR
jgi:AcrR family transcriptional regulator